MSIRNHIKLAKCFFDNIILKKATPYMLIFEPSQLCNCRCEFCYHWKEPTTNELTKEEITSVLRQAYKLGCGYLLLNGGEPTIAKHFMHTLKTAKSIGYSISITTNGSTLAEKASEIAPYLDNLTISLDYPDSRHDSERKLPGLFNKIVSGIRISKTYIKNIKLNYSIHRDNADLIDATISLAEQLGVGIYFRLLIQEKTGDDDSYKLVITDKEEIKRIARKLIMLKRKGKPIVSSYCYLKHLAEFRQFTCRLSQFLIHIDAQGRVYNACPKHEGNKDYIYGNIREQPLAQIWFSKKAQLARKQALNCKPNLNCYTACIIEPASVLKPDLGFWIEQFTTMSHLEQFF